MNKLICALVATGSFVMYSQEDTRTEKDYNSFSVEANVGQNKPGDVFAPGYYTAEETNYFNFSAVNHFDLGFRYMLNEKFGLKLDGAYDLISPESGNGSLDFESKQYRIGLQGVVNLRNVLDFHTWTKRIGLLAHAGVQVSRFDPTYRILSNGVRQDIDLSEDNGGIMIGLTPQFKIHRRVVLTGDFTYLYNTRQHYTWDGLANGTGINNNSNNLKSNMVNFSLGLTFYFGKHEEHADFYVGGDLASNPDIENLKKKIDDLENKVNNIQIPVVPTMEEIDARIKNKFDSMPTPKTAENEEVKRKINEGFINVYFDFNKHTPHESSRENISKVINYLRSNPETKMELRGWADIIGKADYNKKLSEKRAERVREVLIKQGGIDPNRLRVVAEGQDASASASDEFGRAMVRRVTFSIVE